MKHLTILLLAAASLAATSCATDDDFDTTTGGGASTTLITETEGSYPTSSIVWRADSTVVLRDHFIVPKGHSLYIEPGVRVVAANSAVKPEIVVLGSLYSMGTAQKPVLFTVADSLKTDRFSRNWGGIICGYDSPELYLNYTVMEYGGAQTTEQSPSYINGLFKTETGEGVPAVHFCNRDGRMVITNSTFINNAEDHIYITGGNSIVSGNLFVSCGYDGGEAVNYKSDCTADIAYNVIYDANTNAFKLSNSGLVAKQSDINVYNNTVLNTGWRRPKVKGGSVWLETSILARVFNNLFYDCRWGMKHSTSEGEDPASVITPNYYYSSTAVGVEQMQANAKAGIINGADDLRSATPGDLDPLFASFTRQADVNINVASNTGSVPQAWSDRWDLHLTAGSPALKGGNTTIAPHFATTGIRMSGLSGVADIITFYSPRPSEFFGAYGTK